MTDQVDLLANHAANAANLRLNHETLSPDQTVSGVATVGTAKLGTIGTAETGLTEIGVWEISPSVSRDIEEDEFFVVLSGAAEVTFEDGSPAMTLGPGSVGRFSTGTATTWTVTETLRKIYITQ